MIKIILFLNLWETYKGHKQALANEPEDINDCPSPAQREIWKIEHELKQAFADAVKSVIQ